jgi:hypothetical protein
MFDDPTIGIGGAISPYGQNVDAMVEQITSVASGILSGTNIPYLLSDFLNACPRFGGSAIPSTGAMAGTATIGSNVLSRLSSTTGITPGMLVVGVGYIPDGVTVTVVGATTVTLSAPAIASGSVNLIFYPLLVPLFILQMYLGLGNAVILQIRYKSFWQAAIGFFIAHFVTLYMMSMTPAGASAQQVMVAGEARGLKTGKSAGDVSVSVDFAMVAKGIDGWAAYHLTLAGQMFASIGKLAGMGGMYVR